jgi:hypothetical protein
VDARRVLRPDGSVLIAWHSTTSPRRIQGPSPNPSRGGTRP